MPIGLVLGGRHDAYRGLEVSEGKLPLSGRRPVVELALIEHLADEFANVRVHSELDITHHAWDCLATQIEPLEEAPLHPVVGHRNKGGRGDVIHPFIREPVT